MVHEGRATRTVDAFWRALDGRGRSESEKSESSDGLHDSDWWENKVRESECIDWGIE